MKRFQVILSCEAADGYDLDNVVRLTPLLQSRNLQAMLGFKPTIVAVSEETPTGSVPPTKQAQISRTGLLAIAADELDRVGFNDLPEYLGHNPLGLRLVLSFSQAGFVPIDLPDLLRQLSRFDVGELAAMGPAAAIVFFDAFGSEPEGAFDAAVEVAVSGVPPERLPEPELEPEEPEGQHLDAWARKHAAGGTSEPEEPEQQSANTPPEVAEMMQGLVATGDPEQIAAGAAELEGQGWTWQAQELRQIAEELAGTEPTEDDDESEMDRLAEQIRQGGVQ